MNNCEMYEQPPGKHFNEQISAKHETNKSVSRQNRSKNKWVPCQAISMQNKCRVWQYITSILCMYTRVFGNNFGRANWNPTLELLLLNPGLCHQSAITLKLSSTTFWWNSNQHIFIPHYGEGSLMLAKMHSGPAPKNQSICWKNIFVQLAISDISHMWFELAFLDTS